MVRQSRLGRRLLATAEYCFATDDGGLDDDEDDTSKPASQPKATSEVVKGVLPGPSKEKAKTTEASSNSMGTKGEKQRVRKTRIVKQRTTDEKGYKSW